MVIASKLWCILYYESLTADFCEHIVLMQRVRVVQEEELWGLDSIFHKVSFPAVYVNVFLQLFCQSVVVCVCLSSSRLFGFISISIVTWCERSLCDVQHSVFATSQYNIHKNPIISLFCISPSTFRTTFYPHLHSILFPLNFGKTYFQYGIFTNSIQVFRKNQLKDLMQKGWVQVHISWIYFLNGAISYPIILHNLIMIPVFFIFLNRVVKQLKKIVKILDC